MPTPIEIAQSWKHHYAPDAAEQAGLEIALQRYAPHLVEIDDFVNGFTRGLSFKEHYTVQRGHDARHVLALVINTDYPAPDDSAFPFVERDRQKWLSLGYSEAEAYGHALLSYACGKVASQLGVNLWSS